MTVAGWAIRGGNNLGGTRPGNKSGPAGVKLIGSRFIGQGRQFIE